MMSRSARIDRRVSAVIGWAARIGGTVLLWLQWRHGVYEATVLAGPAASYGNRILSVGFLAMLLGIVLGWLSYRGGAALIIGGYVLAVAAPFLGECSRPELATTHAGLAIALLPFLAVGIGHAYAGRRRPPFA